MDILKLRGVLALVLTLGFVTSVVDGQGYCQIDIDAAPESFNPPLLVRSGRNQVLYPEVRDGIRLLSIEPGTKLIAACPGKRNGMILSNEKAIDLTCNDGQLTEQSGSQVITWEGLGCLRRPRANVRVLRNSICGEEGTRYDIGWIIRSNLFVPLIHLCYDADKEITEFTFHKLQGRSIGVKTVDSSRPGFRSANMFTVDVKQIYKKKSQIPLFTELLGTSEYLTGRGQHYLARGHMAPDSDFFYAAEQDATYFYSNVVPQWQAVNNGNWKRLEYAIRELAEKHQTTFDIWTGSYGTLQMPDANNNGVNMFLGLAEGKTRVPVPALTWKVIYNPVIRHAVAIVTVNDVSGQGSSKDVSVADPPCNDICDQLSWIDWDTSDISRGRTFCCDLRDLRATIPTLPDLGRVALLEN